MNPSPPPRRLRWWPALLILALVTARIIQVWVFKDYQRQFKVMGTGMAVLAGLALLLVWWLFLSRVRWRARWLGLAGTLAALLLAAALFRFVGVSGDLVPIFEPRWRTRPPAALAAVTNAVPAAPAAAAFPQFLGPTRDGVVTGLALATNWTAHPPQELWRQPVGEGWGGFVVAEGRAFTLEQDGPQEAVTARDALTGAPLWRHGEDARYDNPVGGVGPRTTPAVAGARVLAVGATGGLRCLDAASGRLLWRRDTLRDGGASVPEWGVSASPFVWRDLVITTPGGTNGSVIAYRLADGEPAWRGGTARAGYSSPRVTALAGMEKLLVFDHLGVSAYAPTNGAPLWSYGWPVGHPHVTDPVPFGTDGLLVSSGYGTGSELLRVGLTNGAWAAERVWKSIRLKSKFANLILDGGYAYGLDDGRLTCIEVATGERRWQGTRYGHGQLLRVEEVLLVTAENGEVALVALDPAAFRELTRFRALTGKTWNPPALAADLLLVRHATEAAAFRLPRR
ncbi:MAG: PQQ-binding-like beta-propeller repeat protein [Limisphaerales bacterium]